MSDELKDYIYNNLDQKETDELVEIWQKNDRVEWSDETFDVLEQILKRRHANIPPQNEPILESPEKSSQIMHDKDFTLITLRDENSPRFYDPKEVLILSEWLNRMAMVYVVISVVLALYSSQGTLQYIWTSFFGTIQYQQVFSPLSVLFFQIIVGVLVYFALKALSHILKIIMEMEFNSRGVKFVFSEKKNKQV